MSEQITHHEDDERVKPRVLVVDDEPRIRSVLLHALQLFGYEADAVARGEDALDRLALASYDVMILDLQMPGMDGITVMRKARELRPDLLTIILTGHASFDNASAAANLEAVAYLRKPASVQQILTAVGQAWQTHQSLAQRQALLDALARMTEPLRAQTPSSRPTREDGWLHVGSLAFDPWRREVQIADRSEPSVIHLTEGESDVLAKLMAKPGQAISCQELARSLIAPDMERWNAESVVRPIVFRLRKKFATLSGQPHLIRAVRGSGYMLLSEPEC